MRGRKGERQCVERLTIGGDRGERDGGRERERSVPFPLVRETPLGLWNAGAKL